MGHIATDGPFGHRTDTAIRIRLSVHTSKGVRSLLDLFHVN